MACPPEIQALIDKGMEIEKSGKQHDAIAWYDKALRIDPNCVTALTCKGKTLANLGKIEEANSLFDKVLQIDPKHVGAQEGKKLIHLKTVL